MRQASVAYPPLGLSLALTVVGLVAWALGLWVDPRRAAFSWLTAFSFAASIAIGALLFLMISYAINAKWVAVLRRLNECIAIVVLPLAVAFVPVVLQAPLLYSWVEPNLAELSEHERHLLEHKRAYLNLPFFALRGAFFFAIFGAIAMMLRVWSLRRDGVPQVGDPREGQAKFRGLSAATLPLVALALTFAAFDWLMSLEPFWYSAIYGVYVFAGGFLGAIATLTILAYLCQRRRCLPEVSGFHFHALGRLLLAFTIFWAYAGFFQAVLIKLANKPDEVTYYLRRSDGGWSYVMWALIVGHFVLPFFVLLIRSIKYRGEVMAVVAAWLLAMHWLDAFWMVVPVLQPDRVTFHWLDAAALAAVGGGCVSFGLWRQRGKPLLATGDPFLASGVEYRSA